MGQALRTRNHAGGYAPSNAEVGHGRSLGSVPFALSGLTFPVQGPESCQVFKLPMYSCCRRRRHVKHVSGSKKHCAECFTPCGLSRVIGLRQVRPLSLSIARRGGTGRGVERLEGEARVRHRLGTSQCEQGSS